MLVQNIQDALEEDKSNETTYRIDNHSLVNGDASDASKVGANNQSSEAERTNRKLYSNSDKMDDLKTGNMRVDVNRRRVTKELNESTTNIESASDTEKSSIDVNNLKDSEMNEGTMIYSTSSLHASSKHDYKKQVAQTYQSVYMKRLLSLRASLTVLSNNHHMERLIVEYARNNDMQVKPCQVNANQTLDDRSICG